jgi:hypothetical protein
MHSDIAISNQHSDYWTKSSSLNKSSVWMETDLSGSFSSAEGANALQYLFTPGTIQNHILGFLAKWKNFSFHRSLGYAAMITFQDQTILECVITLSQYFDLTRDLVFLRNHVGRLSRSHDNRPAPIYFDANSRIYR